MKLSRPRLIVSLAGGSLAILGVSLVLSLLVNRFHLGGDPAGDGMLSGMIVLPAALAALGLSMVAFVMTVRARGQLNICTRLFGVFPAVAYVLAVVVDLLS